MNKLVVLSALLLLSLLLKILKSAVLSNASSRFTCFNNGESKNLVSLDRDKFGVRPTHTAKDAFNLNSLYTMCTEMALSKLLSKPV